MIGDVPKGASLRCRLGRHVGQEAGGTMCFTCPRCGGSYWQPHDYSAVTVAADALIDCGDFAGARALVQRTVGRSKP